jgi:hypothetical protein
MDLGIECIEVSADVLWRAESWMAEDLFREFVDLVLGGPPAAVLFLT